MSDLLREIDEEVAKDRSEQFWERWAIPVGIILAIVIAGLFLYFTWEGRTQANAQACADSYDSAIQSFAVDPLEAQAQLNVITEGCGGFNQLASFKLGHASLAQGDEAEAISIWQSFADDTGNQDNLRNLARFNIAWHGMGLIDVERSAGEIAYLESLPAYTAYTPVLRALEAVERGDTVAAMDQLQAVMDDAEASPLSRNFALSVMALINDA